jgi:hypothetical protein
MAVTVTLRSDYIIKLLFYTAAVPEQHIYSTYFMLRLIIARGSKFSAQIPKHHNNLALTDAQFVLSF